MRESDRRASRYGLQYSIDHRPARARHPDAIGLDGVVQLAAVLVLEDEGFEGVTERGAGSRYVSSTR